MNGKNRTWMLISGIVLGLIGFLMIETSLNTSIVFCIAATVLLVFYYKSLKS